MTRKALVILIALTVFAGAQVFALPPAFPTELDLNLLNLDGTNIDTGLLLTIDYLDSNSNPQSINSVDDSDIVTWEIYNGKSNVYGLISAKDGTDIALTVDGYEPVTVTAVEDGYVSGDYYLNNVTPIPPTTTTIPTTIPTTTTTTTTTTTPTTTTVPPDTTTRTTPPLPSNVAWIKIYNSGGNDGATGVAVDLEGNIIVTGTSDSGYFTIKYDSGGNQLWTRRYGDKRGEATGVAVDLDGNVIVTGNLYWEISWYEYYPLGTYTIKYDPDGNQLWTKYDSGGGYETSGVAADSDGNVIVTGGSGTIKYDSDGNQLWTASYSGYGVAADSDGNVIVTGGSGTIKYDSDGNQLWTASYSGYGVAADSDGNVIVTKTSRVGRWWEDPWDYHTIKYDPDGNLLWEKTYDGGWHDEARGVAVDSDGNVIATGTLHYGYYSSDYLLIKYDSDGNQLWNRTYDGGSYDYAYGVAVDLCDNVIVAGTSNGDYLTIKYAADTNGDGVGDACEPTAEVNGPYTGDEGSSITFDGTGSSDPDGVIVSYSWDFGDGSNGTGSSPAHAYGDNGVYTITLTVTDDDGALDTYTTTVTVSNVAPTADAEVDQTVFSGNTVSFSGSFTDPGWLDTHTIEWDFGDDNLATGTLTPTHIYYDKSAYAVTFKVTDDDGGVGESTMTVTVNPIPAVIDIKPNTLNLKGHGRWVTAYIEFPDGYNVEDIDCSSVLLEGEIAPESCDRSTESDDEDHDNEGIQDRICDLFTHRNECDDEDHDNEGASDLRVKFDRADVIDLVKALNPDPPADVGLTLTGSLADGTRFEGSDTIRVREKGKHKAKGKHMTRKGKR